MLGPKAIRNGFLLMDLLLIDHKDKEIQVQEQFTLGEFKAVLDI
jgi:hypothetical protein